MSQQSEALPLLLLQAREATVGHFKPILQQVGISEPQWRIIRVLSAQGELEASLLAKQSCILGPSLTGILGRMEKAGHVQRRRADKDQRYVLVSLTAGGAALFQQVRPLLEAYYAEISRAFGDDNLRQLNALLAELTTSVGLLSSDG